MGPGAARGGRLTCNENIRSVQIRRDPPFNILMIMKYLILILCLVSTPVYAKHKTAQHPDCDWLNERNALMEELPQDKQEVLDRAVADVYEFFWADWEHKKSIGFIKIETCKFLRRRLERLF